VVEVVWNVSKGFTIGEAMTKNFEKNIVYWVIGELRDRSKKTGGQVETAIMRRIISRLRTHAPSGASAKHRCRCGWRRYALNRGLIDVIGGRDHK